MSTMNPATAASLAVSVLLCEVILTVSDVSIISRQPYAYIEKLDSFYLFCSRSEQLTSTLRWTVVKEDGTVLHLATCPGRRNCTIQHKGTSLGASWNGYFSVYNVGPELAGNLTCTETFLDGRRSSDSHVIRLVRIQARRSRQDVEEYSSANLTCRNSPFPGTITWTLTTLSGASFHLGGCEAVKNCTSAYAPDIVLTRESNTSSQASFTSFKRGLAGRLQCRFTVNGREEFDTMEVNVYGGRPSVQNCSLEIVRQNWSAIFTCEITNVFSSFGIYTFSLCQNYDPGNIPWPEIEYGPYLLHHPRVSYGESLAPYTNNKTVYYRGRLFYSWRLPSSPGHYCLNDVVVDYGWNARTTEWIVDEWRWIETPGKLHIQCTANASIVSPVLGAPCVCSVGHLGSPAGRLVWLLGETVLARGDYGVSRLELPCSERTRRSAGLLATCLVDWINATSVSVILPPCQPDLSAHPSRSLPREREGADMWTHTVLIVIVVVVVASVLCRRRWFKECMRGRVKC